MRETEQDKDTADREYSIDPNSCFSDLSYSLNSVNVPLPLGKIPNVQFNLTSRGNNISCIALKKIPECSTKPTFNQLCIKRLASVSFRDES